MKATFVTLTLAASSQALTAGSSTCCFGLTAKGGPGGPVRQLSDGQNRIGDNSLPLGTYCISSGGRLTDSKGRGCILTPPTTQWQCNESTRGSAGFSVGCNGTLAFQGGSTQYSCPTEQNGGWNIYTHPVRGQPKCLPVWLTADNCNSGCSTTSISTAPCTTSSAPPTPLPPKPVSTCPAQLTGDWEFPHLIVPINSAKADKAYGTSFNGTIGGTKSSIFNFDIPRSAKGKICSLQFLFPTQSQLETSAYTFSGSGKFKFGILRGVATKSTTYANGPKLAQDFGTFTLKPGSAVQLPSQKCPAGLAMSFWMSPVGNSSLNYFQDSNPCPIGLYVTVS